jgi:hypothetical protein
MAAVGLSNVATAILLAAPDVIPVPMDAAGPGLAAE